MKIVLDNLYAIRDHVRRLAEKLKTRKESSYEEIRRIEQELSESIESKQEDSTWLNQMSSHQTWKFWVIGVFTVLLGYFLFKSLEIIYLILTAFIISMAIESVIVFFQRKLSRWLSMFIAYLLLLVFLFLWLIIVIPFLIQQFADLVTVLIDRVAIFQQSLQQDWLASMITDSNLPRAIKESLLQGIEEGGRVVTVQNALIDNASQIVGAWSSYIKNAGGVAVAIVGWFFTGIFKFTITFVMAVFFSLEKEKVITVIANVSWRAKYTKLKLLKLYKKLGYWLKGQFILCVCIGVAVWIGLTILWWFGFPLPDKWSLALIAWLTEFIPYLWPFLGMIPAILVGVASYGIKWLVLVVIIYWIIQQAENNILVPMIMNRTLGISPLVIFISMIVGGTIFGFLWVLMAVPIAVVINILFEEYAQDKHKSKITTDNSKKK